MQPDTNGAVASDFPKMERWMARVLLEEFVVAPCEFLSPTREGVKAFPELW